jgi:signal transduction histidine kinase/ligand-binding sensor domain-containing protein/DNA-binding response OmpR family regulator
MYFNHYNTSNGLSQNSVNYLLQDKQGYIWVASKDGLNRFDGFNFRRIDADDDRGCSFATTLFQDADGLIWTGAHNGAFIYDPATEHLRKFDLKAEDGYVITKPVIQFLADDKGRILLVVDSEGVWVYDKSSKTLSSLYSSSYIKVNQIVIDPKGRMWIGTFGQGLLYSDDNMATMKTFRPSDSDFTFDNAIVSHLALKGDKLYVATDRLGLHAIDLRDSSVNRVFPKVDSGDIPYIRQIMFGSSGQLYIATEDGVFIHDLQQNQLSAHLTHNLYDKYSISDNAVYALLNDREGGVWVGSYFGGVDYAPSSHMQFDKYYPDNSGGSLSGQRVRELCETPSDGRIFVGTEDNGLSLFNPATGDFSPVAGITSKNIHALCLDGSKLWIGTFAEGLRVKDLVTGNVTRYSSAHGLGSDYVFSIIRTMNGDMLLGTMHGLYLYNRATDRFECIPQLDNIFIYDMMEDRDGNLWVATYDHGLYVREPGKSEWITWRWNDSDPDSLPSDKVYGLYQDSLSTIWVMTQDGLCSFLPPADSSPLSSGKFRRDLLGTDRIKGMVYQVVDDNRGRLWLTTNHGLYCIERKSADLHRFSVSSGLPSNQFNYRSSLLAGNGRIYLGTTEGLVALTSADFSFSSHSVTPVITEFHLHGRPVRPDEPDSPLTTSISLTEDLYLSSKQNTLGFRVASLDYSAVGEQGIMYRLKGFESDWHYTNLSDALISYPNLDYGNYTLQVAPYNEFSESDTDPLELKIHIAPPFYLSWWAWLIYIVTAFSVIYVIFRLYRRNAFLKNQRYLENYTAEKEREAYDSKIRFFTNVAHEIRTPLTLIKAPLDCVSRSKEFVSDSDTRDNLDVINMNVDRLLLLANQLLDFRKMEDGKFQIHRQPADITALLQKCVTRFRPTMESAGRTLTLNLPTHEVMANVDSEAITKIISNLFTNAIKYGESRIGVELTGKGGGFTLIISNDGEVVAPQKREEIFGLFSRLEEDADKPGTGIGLSYARSLAQMHGGTLRMDDSPEENRFILSVPPSEADAAPVTEEVVNREPENLEEYIRKSECKETILLVDDNMELLTFLEKKLTASGFKVIKASDGKVALEVLANEYVDIVVSDVMMPEVDGIELLRRIKSDVNYSHLPVIMLTAKTRLEDKLTGLDCGADAYLEKPFAIEYLLGNIRMLLLNRQRMRERLEKFPFTGEMRGTLNKVDEEFLLKLNEIIRTNCRNPEFTIDDVVDRLGMSRTLFYRKVRGMLNLNPNDYIKVERLKQAAAMFAQGHTHINTVAYEVGFSSPGYFAKCFKKHFGMSPTDYVMKYATRTGFTPHDITFSDTIEG